MSEQAPFDPLETANQYTDYEAQIAEQEKQANFEREWLNMHGDATPAEIQQAARDTANYFGGRPASEENVAHPDTHYNESMGQTDQDKSMKELIAEQAQAEVNSDRTRANDIQAELNGRIITSGEKRDAKYDQASMGKIEREAHLLNTAFNQKERIKAGLTPEAGAPEGPSGVKPEVEDATADAPEADAPAPTDEPEETPAPETDAPEADAPETDDAPAEEEPTPEADEDTPEADEPDAPEADDDSETDPEVDRINGLSDAEIAALSEDEAAVAGLSDEAYAALRARESAIEAARAAELADINDGGEGHADELDDPEAETPEERRRLATAGRALQRWWRGERGYRIRDQIARAYNAVTAERDPAAAPDVEADVRRATVATVAGEAAVHGEVDDPEDTHTRRRTLRDRLLRRNRDEELDEEAEADPYADLGDMLDDEEAPAPEPTREGEADEPEMFIAEPTDGEAARIEAMSDAELLGTDVDVARANMTAPEFNYFMLQRESLEASAEDNDDGARV